MGLCSVLMVSCDAYSDLWPIFWKLFNKNWGGKCPFPLFMGSNFAKYSGDGITSLTVGEDISWGDNVASMLKELSRNNF